jgi:hypothetical protein
MTNYFKTTFFDLFSITQDLQEEVPFCLPLQVVLHLQQLLLSSLSESFLKFLCVQIKFLHIIAQTFCSRSACTRGAKKFTC